MKAAGIVIIIVGIAMVVFTGIDFQTKEKVVDLGPLELNQEKEHHLGWPTYVGGLVIIGGITLTIAGYRSGKTKN